MTLPQQRYEHHRRGDPAPVAYLVESAQRVWVDDLRCRDLAHGLLCGLVESLDQELYLTVRRPEGAVTESSADPATVGQVVSEITPPLAVAGVYLGLLLGSAHRHDHPALLAALNREVQALDRRAAPT